MDRDKHTSKLNPQLIETSTQANSILNCNTIYDDITTHKLSFKRAEVCIVYAAALPCCALSSEDKLGVASGWMTGLLGTESIITSLKSFTQLYIPTTTPTIMMLQTINVATASIFALSPE